MQVFQVIAADWSLPNVIGETTDKKEARAFAAAMDGLALRCYVREVEYPDGSDLKPMGEIRS